MVPRRRVRRNARGTGNDGCAAFPSASFDDLGLPTSGVDIFCAGHIQMPDQRRLMVIGGTDAVTGDYGEIRVRIFTDGKKMLLTQ